MGGTSGVTKAQALAAVQKVLTGEIPRQGLAGLRTVELAYVTVALMLALQTDYLEEIDGIWYSLAPLTKTADKLVVHGVPHARMHHVSGLGIGWCCQKHGLSGLNPRPDKSKAMQIKPPEEVCVLVAESTNTNALARFKAEVDAEAKRRVEELLARRAARR